MLNHWLDYRENARETPALVLSDQETEWAILKVKLKGTGRDQPEKGDQDGKGVCETKPRLIGSVPLRNRYLLRLSLASQNSQSCKASGHW